MIAYQDLMVGMFGALFYSFFAGFPADRLSIAA
jgi:hypothetical protein